MKTKSRSPNWSYEEIRVLIISYIDRQDIIEGKITLELTFEDKQKAYEELTDAVNAVTHSGHRSVEQVKKQLFDSKYKTKKKANAICANGEPKGGHPFTSLKLSPIEELLLSAMNGQTSDGVNPDDDNEVIALKEKVQNCGLNDNESMVCIRLNDIFDELREQNKRLLNENKEIFDLLSKYRNISLNFHKFCVCNQKSNDFVFKSLEEKYQKFSNQRKTHKTINESLEKTSKDKQISPQNDDKNTDESEGNGFKETAEDSDTDYEVSDGNDTQFNNISDEEITETKMLCKSETQFVCYVCNKAFKWRNGLTKHKSLFHTSTVNPTLKCEYEDCHQMFFNWRQLISHQITGHKKPGLECDIEGCHKMFRTAHTLAIHKRTPKVHQKEEIKCDYPDCGKAFKSYSRINQHKKECHTDKQIPCDWPGCGKTFKNTKLYKQHTLCHSLKNKEIKCNVEGCHKVFHTKQRLSVHIAAFHLKKLRCFWPGCDMSFGVKSNLTGHINKEHKDVRPFKCTFEGCDKSFYNICHLRAHKQNLHINRKTDSFGAPLVYKCNECCFETDSQRRLNSHITRMHRDEKRTVECTHEGCSKMFRNRDNMLSHLRVVHHSSNRLYCDWPGCDFSTTTGQRTIDDHKRYHIGSRDFKCDFVGCDKSFVTMNMLRRHRLAHQKRFVCSWPECEQRFTLKMYLTSHMNSHLNLRPFKCTFDDCDKDFKIDRHLKKHLRAAHNIYQSRK